MTRTLRLGDAFLVLVVVAIAAMLVTPLPTQLLDFLLVINLSFAVLLLLVGLYVPNSLALLSFPTILLLSTLFRLGLNVASARLILSQGDAGRVIESFGTFLIRGELVVGIIIFLIITIVNFIVIARGAGRVSEVAARFTLDALPGKQLAIDSDVRAGLISAEEASRKREELRRESQLYGSMDGAMQFIQGDAIAGLVIIATNLLGGLYLGLSQGQSFADAIQTYTVLTVGDGLVTQIPALLTSICAGIIVTRVSSSDSATLSSDLASQLFSSPAALTVTGVVLIVLALLAGLPVLPFIVVGVACIGTGIFLSRKAQSQELLTTSRPEHGAALALPGGSGAVDEELGDEEGLTLHLDSTILFRSYRSNMQRFRSAWHEFRNEFYTETGVRLPDMRVVADDLATSASFSIELNETRIHAGNVIPDGVLIEVNPAHAQLMGLDVLKEVDHPLTGQKVFWALQTPALKRIIDAGNLRVFDFFSYACLLIARFATEHPEEFYTATDVYAALRQLEKKHPGLVAEGFGKGMLSVPRLTEVLQNLIKDGVNVRDFRAIVESIAAYCSSTGLSSADDGAVDVQAVVSFVRSYRRRHVANKWVSQRGVLRVVSVSPATEELFEGLMVESMGSVLPLDPDLYERLKLRLLELIKPSLELGTDLTAVLCRKEVRSMVAVFVRAAVGKIPVLSIDELEPTTVVERVGVWSV